jgi:hypothetical protein
MDHETQHRRRSRCSRFDHTIRRGRTASFARETISFTHTHQKSTFKAHSAECKRVRAEDTDHMIVSPDGSLLPTVDREDNTAGRVQRVHTLVRNRQNFGLSITMVEASHATANVTCTDLSRKGLSTFGPIKRRYIHFWPRGKRRRQLPRTTVEHQVRTHSSGDVRGAYIILSSSQKTAKNSSS